MKASVLGRYIRELLVRMCVLRSMKEQVRGRRERARQAFLEELAAELLGSFLG